MSQEFQGALVKDKLVWVEGDPGLLESFQGILKLGIMFLLILSKDLNVVSN